MSKTANRIEMAEPERYELREAMPRLFEMDRRGFMQFTASGLLIALFADESAAQWDSAVKTLESRLLIGKDGRVTILTGKVEEGQGARTQLAMVAAEELGLPISMVSVEMADTDRTPDDGITAGSRTTPSTVPRVRQAAGTARAILVAAASSVLGVDKALIVVSDGAAQAGGRRFTYADLAASEGSVPAAKPSPTVAIQTRPASWTVLGKPQTRVNGRAIVTGEHKFPSDVARPGMVHGAVLRAPSFGATLQTVNLDAVKTVAGAMAMRDGEFVAVVAPNSFAARRAVKVLAESAKWEEKPQPSSTVLFEHLKKTARGNGRENSAGDVDKALASAAVKLQAEYHAAYVQHAPMEPRAAVAEWTGGKLTVWTGTSNPFAVRTALAQTFGLQTSAVRVIVPDFGGGFGGKHTGEAAIEAARLAREVKLPVSVRWTRPEEFTWAYSRPAAVIACQAAIEGSKITAWRMTNINSGTAALECPYDVTNRLAQFIEADSSLRQGSYRSLAAVANNFARESFIDELAGKAGADPLEFRLANLTNPRLCAVLKAAAERFRWKERWRQKRPGRGVGLACGTEKNSVVAACVEVELGTAGEPPKLLEIVEAFECGPVMNPVGLRSQVEGCILMGLGAAIREEMVFENGRVTSNAFSKYHEPRFADTPKMDLIFLDRKDLEPSGAGETPIIVVAPAMGNAVFQGAGKRLRMMPLKG
ncbi:MAG TPA: molybdopterin-dependent oxidoreductase [Bryobacteraceae bacterium]|nr:molybdopterin-dependent oxidoreductase [Bryobacteraceae bacterium]